MAEYRQQYTLSGIRILDLSRVLAGPLCTMLLGDLGADVLKVERPGSGDDTRSWGPPFDASGQSAYYLSINRNKLSVAADLDIPEDIEAVRSWIREADVVVDNYRRGTLERRGIDQERLVREVPGLVWCTITGFGADSDRPGYDFVVQAECGWMAITGEPDGDPMKIGVALADVIAGKDAAIAILAALVGRERNRAGQRITISLAASARAALVNVAQNALVATTDAKRWGNAHPNLVPYELFVTADRPLVIAVGNDAQWRNCARVLGLDDLANDPDLASNPGRLAHRARVVERMNEKLRGATAATWQERFSKAGVPTGIVKDVLDVVREGAGSHLMGMPAAVGGPPRLPPPRLDEHGPLVRAQGWKAFAAVAGT